MTEIRIKSDRIRVGPVVELNLLGIVVEVNQKTFLMLKRIYFLLLIQPGAAACNRSNAAMSNGSDINAKHPKFFK